MASAATQEHRGGVLGHGRHRLVGGTLLIASVVAEDQGRYIFFRQQFHGISRITGTSLARQVFSYVPNSFFVTNYKSESSNVVVVAAAASAAQHNQVVDAETSVTITCHFSGSPRLIIFTFLVKWNNNLT